MAMAFLQALCGHMTALCDLLWNSTQDDLQTLFMHAVDELQP